MTTMQYYIKYCHVKNAHFLLYYIIRQEDTMKSVTLFLLCAVLQYSLAQGKRSNFAVCFKRIFFAF